MNCKVKNTIKIIGFLLVFLILFVIVQDIVVPCIDNPPERVTRQIEGLFAEPKDTIDVIFLGTSHIRNAVSPINIYRETGIRSYNLGTASQPVAASYYLLKAVFEEQSPQLVFLDASAFFQTKEERSSAARWLEIIDSLPLSKAGLKYEMTQAWLQDREENDYTVEGSILPIINYHDTYSSLARNEYQLEDVPIPFYSKGHKITYGVSQPSSHKGKTTDEVMDEYTQREYAYYDDNPNISSLKDNMTGIIEYVRLSKELCEKNHCELVLTKIPTGNTKMEYESAWYMQKHNIIQEAADELGLRFVDLNYEETGIDWTEDTRDNGSHINEKGSKQISHFFANWITKECTIKTTETQALQTAWNEQARIYDIHSEIALMKMTYDPEVLFNRLTEGNYTLLCAVSNTLEPTGWTLALANQFAFLTGAEQSMVDSSQYAYIIVSNDGTKITEEKDAFLCMAEGTLPDGKLFYLISKGWYARNETFIMPDETEFTRSGASILIDGVEYAGSSNGMYIVVYDNDLHCVVDIARIETTSVSSSISHNSFDQDTNQKIIDIQTEPVLNNVQFISSEKFYPAAEQLQESTDISVPTSNGLPDNLSLLKQEYQTIQNEQCAKDLNMVNWDQITPYIIDKRLLGGNEALSIEWQPVPGAAEYRYVIKELEKAPDLISAYEKGRIIGRNNTGNSTYLEIPYEELGSGKWLNIMVQAMADGYVSSNASYYVYINDEQNSPVVYPQTNGHEGDEYTTVFRTGPETTAVAIAYQQDEAYYNAKVFQKDDDSVTTFTDGEDVYWMIPYCYQAETHGQTQRTTYIRTTNDGAEWSKAIQSIPFETIPREKTAIAENEFAVYYHLTDEEAADEQMTIVHHGTATELKSISELGFSMDEKVFGGWKAWRPDIQCWRVKDMDGNAYWSEKLPYGGSFWLYNDGTTVSETTPPGTEVHFYAQWVSNEFTVFYHLTDDSEPDGKTTIVQHGTATNLLSISSFNKPEGKETFVGWKAWRPDIRCWRVIDSDGNEYWAEQLPSGGQYLLYGDKAIVSKTTPPGAEVHFYAQWQ